MHRPPCRHCQDVYEPVAINSPSLLEQIVIRAAKKVHSGSLKELAAFQEPANPNRPDCPYPPHNTLSDIVVHKPLCGWAVRGWGDTVDLRFQCTSCGAVFLLHAETYHGSGGAWQHVGHGDS